MSLSKTLFVLVQPRKTHSDRTEKLLIGTLRSNTYTRARTHTLAHLTLEAHDMTHYQPQKEKPVFW